jgi:hypothetical protein
MVSEVAVFPKRESEECVFRHGNTENGTLVGCILHTPLDTQVDGK